jgi:hypothetical protein
MSSPEARCTFKTIGNRECRRKQMPAKPPRKNEDDMDVDDRSSDGSDDGADLEGFIVEDASDAEDNDSAPAVEEDRNEDDEVLAESKRITENLSSTVVGGRTLRNREMIKKPEPFFDAEAYAKIMEAEEKREKIQLLKQWAADGEYVCPILKSLTKKTDAAIVEEEYRKAKRALEIPDTDDEDDTEEDEEITDGEDDEEIPSEEDEDEDDEEEDDEGEEDEEDEEED